MPYHEFTTRGRLHRRSNAVCGRFDLSDCLISSDSELGRLVHRLKPILGAEGFYQWACSLPPGTVGSDMRYADAIRGKLEELEANVASSRAPQQPTGAAEQLYLFRPFENHSSTNSLAQDSSGVTIPESKP